LRIRAALDAWIRASVSGRLGGASIPAEKPSNTQFVKGDFPYNLSHILGGKKSGVPENRPAFASKNRG